MVYGKFVATKPIEYDGVTAFMPGDPVPEDSVKEHGWDEYVEEIKANEPSDADSAIPPDPGEPSGKAAGTKKVSGRGTSSGS